MSSIPSTSGSLHSEFVCLLFLLSHRKTDPFFPVSEVQLPEHDRGHFNYRRTEVSHLNHTLTHHTRKPEWMTFNSHWKKSVWSTRIGRIAPVWNPLPNCQVSIVFYRGEVRSYESQDVLSQHWVPTMLPCSMWFALDPGYQREIQQGSSVLGSPDPRRTKTIARQVSTSRLPEPKPLTVYRVVPQVTPPLCGSMVITQMCIK